MAVQDLIDAGIMDSKSVPANRINTQLVMPDIQLSENGILKLLKDLNPHKEAGPDELKPLVLKELREVIVPMLRVIFRRSIEAGRVPRDLNDANVCPLFKKGDKSAASNYRRKSKRKVQGVPQSQTAALPRPKEEEETDKSKQAQTEQTYEKH